jgi:hypothetical protein
MWVGPQRGTMLGDREIKGAFWIRNRLGIANQEREIEVVLCRARQSGLHLHWHRTVLDLLAQLAQNRLSVPFKSMA